MNSLLKLKISGQHITTGVKAAPFTTSADVNLAIPGGRRTFCAGEASHERRACGRSASSSTGVAACRRRLEHRATFIMARIVKAASAALDPSRRRWRETSDGCARFPKETVVFGGWLRYFLRPHKICSFCGARATDAQYVVGDGRRRSLVRLSARAGRAAFITDCAKVIVHQSQTTEGVRVHPLDVVAHQGKAHVPEFLMLGTVYDYAAGSAAATLLRARLQVAAAGLEEGEKNDDC